MHILNRAFSATLIVASAMVLSQCSKSSPNPASPGSVSGGTSNAVGDTTTSTPAFGQFKVCKLGNVSGTFTVSTTGTGAILAAPTIAPGACVVVAEDFSGSGAGGFITVTETSAGLASISGQRIDVVPGTPTDQPFNNGDNLFLNSFHGYAITFTNNVAQAEGCSPGFFRHNPDSWHVYGSNLDFDATFGVNFFNPDITLLEALGNGGGGFNALGRHAVAALLNSVNPEIDYAYTTDEVFAIVQGTGAYAGLSVKERTDLLAAANTNCPLG